MNIGDQMLTTFITFICLNQLLSISLNKGSVNRRFQVYCKCLKIQYCSIYIENHFKVKWTIACYLVRTSGLYSILQLIYRRVNLRT